MLARNRSNCFQARKSYTTYPYPACECFPYIIPSWQPAAFLCKSHIDLTYIVGLTTGFVRYLPVMISRIMLSLKKAADPQQKTWTLTEPTMTGPHFKGMEFFKPRRGASDMEHDSIPLDTYAESQILIR